MTKTGLLSLSVLLATAMLPLKTIAASDGGVFETRVNTVGCTNSMKAMRYANRGSIKAGVGCQVFAAGTVLYLDENARTAEIHPNRLMRLSNQREGADLFVGYFIGRDIIVAR